MKQHPAGMETILMLPVYANLIIPALRPAVTPRRQAGHAQRRPEPMMQGGYNGSAPLSDVRFRGVLQEDVFELRRQAVPTTLISPPCSLR
jgi:hypothetical protein